LALHVQEPKAADAKPSAEKQDADKKDADKKVADKKAAEENKVKKYYKADEGLAIACRYFDRTGADIFISRNISYLKVEMYYNSGQGVDHRLPLLRPHQCRTKYCLLQNIDFPAQTTLLQGR